LEIAGHGSVSVIY